MLTITEAAALIRRGELVIIPTETVYGIAADATNAAAVARLAEVKQRPDGKAFSWLIASLDDACGLAEITPDAEKLAVAFFPGPLTMILNRIGGGTIGVRCPSHELALDLLREVGVPLATPSANISGQAPSTRYADAVANFGGEIAALDGGVCGVGIESTVLDLIVEPPKILRRGALTKRRIENVIGRRIDGVTFIGITGGTGAGKTTALNVLAERGALIIDCDAVYRELTLTSTEMLAELAVRFPTTVTDGVLDRKILGEIVFADVDALAELNRISHKFVSREVDRRTKAFGGDTVAIDAIALLESGRAKRCDYTVAITAPQSVRAARIMARDGIDEDRALARIVAQKDDSFYENRCDAVLVNDSDADAFTRKCREHFARILD